MNSKLSILMAGVLAVLVLAVLLAVLPVRVGPARADAVTGATTVQVLAFGTVTQTKSASAWVSGYGQADCYATTSQAANLSSIPQTTTFTLYHGWDNINWVPLLTFTDQGTNTVDFTRTLIYGNYLKATATFITTTRPVTGSVVCVAKNVQ